MLFFTDELILCEECCKFLDDVEATIEEHLNEFKAVVHAKRWKKNNKNNQTQKIVMFISISS